MTTRNWSSDMLLLVVAGVFHVVLSGTPVISERSIFRDTEVVRVFFLKCNYLSLSKPSAGQKDDHNKSYM